MPPSCDQYLELLSEFESLPKKACSKSIFDVAGYPHYENVASNVLAFFLNPNNEHGLGKLMLSSLLNLAGANETNQSNVQISREVYTVNGGRLDILIETESQLIGIENKIYHFLANDLEDYGKSLDEWAKPNQLAVMKIILSIRKEKESFGFICITYEEFFLKIKEHLGNYVTTSSQKWLLYLIDFINTIENLKGGDMEFDENDKFFIKNESRINSLISVKNMFLYKLRYRIQKLQEEIKKPDVCEKQWIYAGYCLVHDFNLSGNLIAFDLNICQAGWELTLFGRDQSSNEYIIQLLSRCSDHIAIEKGRLALARWPIFTELHEIKEKLCEWMVWVVKEDANRSLKTDAAQ
ncbi:PD-(D/E)XK nuclease family protein [Castellaniella sp.]|uniref:PD-(D/E)XK nuclease family protein n=1 Tax=Castellaniella sp. TaxID=1955812 RepID=UPI002AFE0AC2|nr:PD-(D/E)XK nuclease family protein [Castellaniella sp.]